MSGVLHPVGPEPARTYWVRRGILLAVVLLVALGIVLAVASLTKAAVATSPPPVIAPASTPSATGDPRGPEGADPTASPNVLATPSTSPTAPASPSAAVTPPVASSTSSQPSTSAASSASRSPSTPASAKAATTPSAKAVPTATPDCRPSDLSVTLKGARSLSPGENNRFKLTMINGGTATCLASVSDENFELKIYSGKERIWSSQDCTKALIAFDKKLAGQADVGWTMTWNGERSVPGKNCKTGGDTPRPGTYWATAQLQGADPVQLRMIVS